MLPAVARVEERSLRAVRGVVALSGAAVVLGDAPVGAGALDNDAKLDAMLDALLVDPRYEYELSAGEE